MSMYYNEQVHELFQNAHGPISYKLDCKCSEQVEALAAETVRI